MMGDVPESATSSSLFFKKTVVFRMFWRRWWCQGVQTSFIIKLELAKFLFEVP